MLCYGASWIRSNQRLYQSQWYLLYNNRYNTLFLVLSLFSFCPLSYFYFVSFILFLYYQQYYLIDNILDNDENPIVKVPLLISEQDGNLVIVEHLDDDNGPISMMMA